MNGAILSVKKARRMRRPSQQNLNVYRQVRELGQTQEAVAARHGVSQQRVSQICRQIERWWARSHAGEPDGDGGRAELVLARQRYQQISGLAMRELAQENVALVTERAWQSEGETKVERTTRTEPQNPQWAKIALSVFDRLAELDARLGPDSQWEFAPLLPALAEVLKSSTSSNREGLLTADHTQRRHDGHERTASPPTTCGEAARSVSGRY